MSETIIAAGEVDSAILEEVREDMEDEFPEFVQVFLDDATGWLLELEQAASAGDAGTLYGTAHAMKSSSGYVGAVGLQALAEKIETLGRNGTSDGAIELVAQLRTEFDAVLPKLKPLAEAS